MGKSYINVADDDVYGNRKIADVPFWYHSFVCSFLSVLGIVGISLNGFIVWNFALRRVVSKQQYDALARNNKHVDRYIQIILTYFLNNLFYRFGRHLILF